MIVVREGALVVVSPPGGSFSFTTDQLDQAEAYGAAVNFGLEMLRRQARHQGKRTQRGKRRGSRRGRERGGS